MSIVVRQILAPPRLLSILAFAILVGLLAVMVQSGFAQKAPTRTGAGSAGLTQSPLCDPTWEVVSSPNSNVNANRLNSIAVVSANDVWAVGSFDGEYGTYPEATLTEHWDGSSWSVVPSANTGGTYGHNRFYAVAASSATDVWAVGYYDTGVGTPRLALTEHWDGGSWSIVAGANIGQSNILYGVATVSVSDAWAVGQYDSSFLIERWDGAQWNVVGISTPISEGILNAVETNGANDAWAVGSHANHALTLHWDGVEWIRVSPPPPDNNTQILTGVAIVSADDAWAVGVLYTCGFCPSQTFIKHWDGGSWSIVDSPSPGTSGNHLNSVTVVSANDVWAVGFDAASGGFFQTLIEHWDGSSWSVVSSPSPGTYSSFLNGVAVVSTEDIWAVGSDDHTLVERYTMCVPTPTPTPEPSPTPVPCVPGVFSDVPSDNPFYPFVTCLVNRDIISGYTDCTFRPNNQVTRGQLAKIVSNAAGFQEDPGAQIFEDVPPESAFYQWVNRLSNRGFMGGYICGGVGEPCVGGGLPYFRPGANATRGQTSKIVANTAGYVEEPTDQTFEDVPPANPFYKEIQRLATRNIMGGYPCGGEGEPCGSDNRPYFRPQNNVTRGQSSKIVANTFFPNCQTPEQK